MLPIQSDLQYCGSQSSTCMHYKYMQHVPYSNFMILQEYRKRKTNILIATNLDLGTEFSLNLLVFFIKSSVNDSLKFSLNIANLYRKFHNRYYCQDFGALSRQKR